MHFTHATHRYSPIQLIAYVSCVALPLHLLIISAQCTALRDALQSKISYPLSPGYLAEQSGLGTGYWSLQEVLIWHFVSESYLIMKTRVN